MTEPIQVLITIPLNDDLLTQLKQISPQLAFHIYKAQKNDEIPNDVWASCEILYTNRVVPEPEQAPNLKWIQFHWAGVDHILEAPILQQPGIQATTLSGAATSQMAEYILMMMLSLGHRLPEMMADQKRGEWSKDRWERFLPLELRGSTVGIVGYGSIGRQVAHLLQPFGAFVLAAKRDAMHPQDDGYIPEGMGDPEGNLVYRLYPAEALRSMMKECDYVVVTVPKTSQTKGLIGAQEIAAMHPGAFLVDVSRGEVVDHAALIQALKDRKIAGAALDVFPEEPLPADNPLWKLPNVLLTPHISGNTPFYNQRAVELFAANLERYLSGASLFNIIDLEQGY